MSHGTPTGISSELEGAADKVSFRVQARKLVIRLVIGITLIMVAYAAMPTAKSDSFWRAVPLTVLAITLFIFGLARQVRRIRSAKFPVMRAIEVLVYSLLIFMVLFASIAVQLDAVTPGSYSQSLDKVAGFYFSVTTLATVGYGDITPVTSTARVICTIQMLGNLVLLGVAFRLLAHEVERRVRPASARTSPIEDGGAANG